MEFVTRVCKAGDEEALSLVAQATTLETYAGMAEGEDLVSFVTTELSVEEMRRILRDDLSRAWIVETVPGKCAVGYAVVVSDQPGEAFASFELKRLYVFHRFHGNGIGKRFIEDVFAFARQMKSETIWLQVQDLNRQAIAFYKHLGFVQTGVEQFRAGKGSYRVLRLSLTLGRG
jgi:diamine N-acetyltransferase